MRRTSTYSCEKTSPLLSEGDINQLIERIVDHDDAWPIIAQLTDLKRLSE